MSNNQDNQFNEISKISFRLKTTEEILKDYNEQQNSNNSTNKINNISKLLPLDSFPTTKDILIDEKPHPDLINKLRDLLDKEIKKYN